MRYTVRPGDSLSTIARAHGLSLAQLLAANPLCRANPNAIRVGDEVEIPDGATVMAPSVPVIPTPPTGGHKELGKLSEEFETGGRGPGTASTGVGDAGGVSYGSYQMTSKNGGTVLRFVSQPAFPWRDDFRGLSPGSPEFTAKWKAIAAAAPEAFHAAQHAYIKATHFDVLAANALDADRLDVTTRSAALQDVIWSTAVQHGPNTPVIHRALAALRNQGVRDVDGSGFDRGLIQAIYAERGRRDALGALVYFANNSTPVQDGVAKRFVREERSALRMLDGP
jgi:murein DD-endopeptidase MepM/ murein hydrolase activator NlpD